MKDKVDILMKGSSNQKYPRAILVLVIVTILSAALGTIFGGLFGMFLGSIIGGCISVALIFILPPTVKQRETETIIVGNASDESGAIQDSVETALKD